MQDPSKDPQLSFGDFAAAAELDPDNADIYHHRGQVDRITLSYVLIVLNFLDAQASLAPTQVSLLVRWLVILSNFHSISVSDCST